MPFEERNLSTKDNVREIIGGYRSIATPHIIFWVVGLLPNRWNSGIGRATVVEFAQGGAKVIIADMQDGKKLVAEIKRAGGEAFYIKCDVSSETAWKA